MAQGRMRAAAFAAALAVSACGRARGCLRALVVLAGLSPHRQERVRMPPPVAKRPVNRRLPALSGVSPVFAEVAWVTSAKTATVTPAPYLMTASLASSGFAVEPIGAGIPVRYARAPKGGKPCALTGPETRRPRPGDARAANPCSSLSGVICLQRVL